jgi:predicted nucleic acid-binding protein
MNNSIFIDTSGWIALLFIWDNLHERASYWLNRAKEQQAKMITSTAVLVEVLHGLAQQNLRHLSPVLKSAISYQELRVVDADSIAFFTAWQLFEDRPDKKWGLTDCMSFQMMKEMRIVDVLTHDIHFAQAGFRPLLREQP